MNTYLHNRNIWSSIFQVKNMISNFSKLTCHAINLLCNDVSMLYLCSS